MKIQKTKQDVIITTKIQEKSFKSGVATFAENVLLFRGTHSVELYEIFINNKKISGNIFSSKIESRIGASFAYNKTDAISAAKATRKFYQHNLEIPQQSVINKGGKILYKGDPYVITVNGNGKQFLHLNLSDYVENKIGEFEIDGSIGNLGLGFSIRGLYKSDIIKVEKIVGNDLIDVTNSIVNDLKEYYDNRTVNPTTSFFSGKFVNQVLSDEEFSKLSGKGKTTYINNLINHSCIIDELSDFQIKKIGKENLNKIIDALLNKGIKSYHCRCSTEFIFKYFTKEQIISYVYERWNNSLNVPKKLEEYFYENDVE